MAATATKSKGYPVSDTTQSTQIVRGTVVLTGNYATHGDVLDLSTVGAQSSKPPVRVFVYDQPPAGTSPSGYEFTYCPGSTPANGKLCVMENAGAAGAFAELPAGAYPAALTGATLAFEAVFLTGI